MSVDFNITAETRTDVGKGASRRLRHASKVPGVVYGGGKDAVSLTIEHDHIMHHLAHEAFYSHILSVSVDGKAEKAVLKDVQRHPSKPRILHVDFLRVSETEKISMHVPLHFINEEIAVGVKTGGGVISHLMSGVDIILTDNFGNSAKIIAADANQCNGVMHAIDSVILPKRTSFLP